MTYLLNQHLAPPRCPAGVHVEQLHPSDSSDAHGLLVLGYANGGGSVAPYSIWWTGLTTDAEYDPALCFVAKATSGQVIGFAQCWTSAFIKDLAVHPSRRRQSVGETLLRHVFEAFRSRGAASVDLKVQVENRSGAIRLYKKVGMRRTADDRS